MFMNLSHDLLGVGPGDGTVFQETSYGRRDGGLPGILGRFQQKCVDLKPGEVFTAADIEGPGLITRIWVTLPLMISPHALRDVVVRMYWDGEDEPSVQVPLGDLFGATFARPVDYHSAYLAITSGAMLCFFPMPFRERAVVTFENQSAFTVRLFFFQLTYLRLDSWPAADPPYFHCHWHREKLERGDPAYEVLEASGRGFYLGCHLDMQGAGIPWRLNPVHDALPEGWGLGMLEGWERMWIDDADEPNVHGTGGEDYFNGAWYFTHVPSTTPTHGVTKRNYVTRRVSCYRLHAEMPVSFRSRFRMTIDHGFDNVLPAVYDGTAFWYQWEPHSALAGLPGPRDRRPGGAARNGLIMCAPLVAVSSAALALARKRATHRA